MFESFLTALAWILFVMTTLFAGLFFAAFMSLSPWQQQNAKVTVSFKFVAVWTLSLAWLIARYFG